jgi:hypothetical protein
MPLANVLGIGVAVSQRYAAQIEHCRPAIKFTSGYLDDFDR